jgi:O-antigen/teichoic acid export membrane protein
MSAAAFLARLKNSRIVRGIGANVYSQLVQTALQLLSVPIYATHWGLATYGAWLVIFTVPNYLAFADFGFAAAAANDMTVSVARGDRAAAIETFHAVRAAMAGICSVVLLICVAAVYAIPDVSLAFVSGLSHEQARYAILMLAAYGVLSIQNSVSLAAFRSIGKYATGTYIHTTINFAENLGALVVVSLGGNIEDAAATYLTVGVLGIAVRMVWLRVQAGWLVYFSWRVSFGQVRRLLHPAFAVLALPMAQALFLQGTVAVVGLAAGAAAVPAFTAVRTLSRIGLQLTMIVNNAVVPEFTMAAASVDHRRRARLAFMSITTSAVILLPMCLVVVTCGPLVLRLWTHGAIHAPYALIVLMALTMVVNGSWLPISNLIFALNRHAQYSYYYLAAAAGSVLLSYPLVKWLGSPGAAVSLLTLDCVMFARVWSGAMAMKVFDPKEVYETAVAEGARLRHSWSKFALRRSHDEPPALEPPSRDSGGAD